MSLLWAVPPVAMTVAMLVALVQLRNIGDATAELTGQLQRVGDIRLAVAEVREASAEARATARGLRSH